MTLNNLIEPSQPVTGSLNTATGFFTNLIDKGIEYKILREENKMALSQQTPKNDVTSSQESAVKPSIGKASSDKNVPLVVAPDTNVFGKYIVPSIAVVSGLLAIYAFMSRKGGK
jgi:hypothetical protein